MKILTGDCRKMLPKIPNDSVHLVVTDPPYFLDGLDGKWRKGGGKLSTGRIKHMPSTMQFDREQGECLYAFLAPVARELFRCMKPGAFLLLFSSPRLYHRSACAFDDAGFEIRDKYIWRFRGKAQFKAFSMDHFIKNQQLPEKRKAEIIEQLQGRRTPQLRPQFEPIMLGQKPRQGTFVDNWIAHETGLIDVSQTLTGKVPDTVMTVEKEPKADYNRHLTVKPVRLIEHLIRLFSVENQIVLDPFLGSGTTAVAAKRTNRQCIGMEINPDYVKICRKRVKEIIAQDTLFG